MFKFVIEMSGLQKKLSGSTSKKKAQEKFEENIMLLTKTKKLVHTFKIHFGYQK